MDNEDSKQFFVDPM